MGGTNEEVPLNGKPKQTVIKVEDIFSNHLKIMNINPTKIAPHILKELKKAFYAGFAHLIGVQNFVVGNHSQEEAGKILDDVARQVDKYLISVTKK